MLQITTTLDNTLPNISSKFVDNIAEVVADYAELIATRAQILAPKDTGFMAESIYAITTRGSGRQSARRTARKLAKRAFVSAPNASNVAIKGRVGTRLSAYVVAGAEYSHFVEFGTHKMAARPFFYPAANAYMSGFIADVGKALVRP
jgi:HK97 gp10 family phage protein